MQSLTRRPEHSYISLGERRGRSDLARFSLDLSWARAVSDSAHLRAYPSPPMSGSPPLGPRRNLDASDRGHGSYGSSSQDIFREPQISQAEQIERNRGPPMQGYQGQQQLPQVPYSSYRMEDMSQQLQYQSPRSQLPPQQQQLPQQSQHFPPAPPSSAAFATGSAPSIGEGPEFSSPKAQRKTKGHVASACVPCKRAHLRCDAQRPCSRCLSNGKEDACVDVQHKKRGRPRLREEPRYAVEPSYPPPESMRRPLSLYGPDTAVSTPFSDALHRSGSYRVLKSQGGIGGPIASRYPEHQTPPENPSLYGGSMTPNTRIPLLPQEPICAYLTMEMQVAKSTKVFEETIGVQPVTSRNLQDIVSPSDRDKVFRLQRLFDDERRVREPNYLPPIYLKYEEDRVIQSVGFGPEDVRQPEADRSEMITFQSPDGQQRTFQLRFGLAKKESTYFVVVVIDVPTTPQPFHPSSSPYTREPYHRDPQYGYHPQSGYQPSHPPTRFMPNPPYGEPQPSVPSYRTPGSLSSNMSPFLQASSQRSDYVQGQSNPYQTPRSEGHIQGQSIVQTQSQTQAHSQRQRDLQLPPIRDQRGGDELSGRRDDRARFDIGGLLENPDPSGRSQ